MFQTARVNGQNWDTNVTGLRFSATFALCICSLTIWGGAPGAAQELVPTPYNVLAEELDARITFEQVPRRPEPGWQFDAPIRDGRAWLGERFAGQSVVTIHGRQGARFDGVRGQPSAQLGLSAGEPGRNLSVAFHRGLGSNALFALGPDGFDAISGRGEGAVAVLFDDDQYAFGLVIHTAYPDPLGHDAVRRGVVELRFYDRAARLLGRYLHHPERGRSTLGLVRAEHRRDIAGVLILNTDPGGIAIDDILYAHPIPLG